MTRFWQGLYFAGLIAFCYLFVMWVVGVVQQLS